MNIQKEGNNIIYAPPRNALFLPRKKVTTDSRFNPPLCFLYTSQVIFPNPRLNKVMFIVSG